MISYDKLVHATFRRRVLLNVQPMSRAVRLAALAQKKIHAAV